MKANRINLGNTTTLAELAPRALTVKIAHSLLQPQEVNPCLNSPCEHLCLLSRSKPGGYRCECQIGYVKVPNNENRCNIDRTEFLMVLTDNLVGGLRIFPNDSVPLDDSSSTPSVPDNNERISDRSYGDLVREGGFLWDRLVPVNDILFGFDFAYDFNGQSVYWLEHNMTTWSMNVQRVQMDGERRETFSGTDNTEILTSPFCIDFDATSRNLIVGNYFHGSIEAIDVDTR